MRPRFGLPCDGPPRDGYSQSMTAEPGAVEAVSVGVLRRDETGQQYGTLMIFLLLGLGLFISSLAWPRYAFAPLVLLSIFVVKVFGDLTDGLRFDWNETEIFFARHDDGRGTPILVPNFLARLPAEEGDSRPGALVQAPALGTVADDAKGSSDSCAGVDGEIDSLVRHECRHDEEMTLRYDVSGMIEDRVDRRIHDRRFAIIVSADPAGNVG